MDGTGPSVEGNGSRKTVHDIAGYANLVKTGGRSTVIDVIAARKGPQGGVMNVVESSVFAWKAVSDV